MLPSGYQQVEAVRTYGSYIDTGIVSAGDLAIDCVLSDVVVESITGGLFGARNTNSNTSNGQMYVYQGSSSMYFGFNATRTSITLPTGGFSGDGFFRFQINRNYIRINDDVMVVKELTRPEASFTGTRNIYVGAYNNGGTASSVSEGYFYIHYFKIWKNGTLIRDYVPCIRLSDNVVGMYDLVNDLFYEPVGTFYTTGLFTVNATATQGGTVRGDIGLYSHSVIKAYPNSGYAFDGWYENGSFVSLDNPIVTVKKNADYTAKFSKIVEDNLNVGYKLFVKDRYSLLNGIVAEIEVIDAIVNEDYLQKSVSTFRVATVPSNVMIGHIVLLYSPKGKKVYQGVIQNIEDKTITCREIMAYFDTPFLFHTNTSTVSMTPVGYTNVTLLSLQYALSGYINSLLLSQFENTEHSTSGTLNERYSKMLIKLPTFYENNFADVNFPLIADTEVKNFEEMLFEIYRQFGVVLEFDFNPIRNISQSYNGTILISYPNYDVISIGDNVEAVKNLEIVLEQSDVNIIYIYNQDGTSFRQMYKANGVSTNVQEGSVEMKEAIILSDDALETIKAQYIKDNDLNHKIKFDYYFSDVITFDDIKMGQKVNFYSGNKVYNSVVTARSYEIGNSDKISHINLTLGNMRNNLTSKLNLGKVK